MAEKAGYPHFMLKEIYEQPWAVRETVLGRTSAETGRVYLHEMGLDEAALRGDRSRRHPARAARRGTRAWWGSS